jgi:hypothetical protein
MRNIIRTLIVLAGVTIASNAHAACYYNGTSYSSGTQIGSLVCTPSGRWQKP